MRRKINWVSPQFWKKGFDPGIVDPCLSEKGLEQIEEERELVYALGKPDFILVSPLRRALMTARALWPDMKMLSCPQAREIAKTLGDCGSDPETLKTEFPNVDFSPLTQDWWRSSDTPEVPKHWDGESSSLVNKRIEEWKQIILDLPKEHENIFCVGHSMFYRVVTGEVKMENVGVITVLIHPNLEVEVVENHRSASRLDPLYSATNATTNLANNLASQMTQSMTNNYAKYLSKRSGDLKSGDGSNAPSSSSSDEGKKKKAAGASSSMTNSESPKKKKGGLSGKIPFKLDARGLTGMVNRGRGRKRSPNPIEGVIPPLNAADMKNSPRGQDGTGLDNNFEIKHNRSNDEDIFNLIDLDDWIQPQVQTDAGVGAIPGQQPTSPLINITQPSGLTGALIEPSNLNNPSAVGSGDELRGNLNNMGLTTHSQPSPSGDEPSPRLTIKELNLIDFFDPEVAAEDPILSSKQQHGSVNDLTMWLNTTTSFPNPVFVDSNANTPNPVIPDSMNNPSRGIEMLSSGSSPVAVHQIHQGPPAAEPNLLEWNDALFSVPGAKPATNTTTAPSLID